MRTRAPGQSALLLLDLADELTKQKVDYAVIGAMAASVHGAIRATIDADALLSVSVSRLRKLQKEFQIAGFDTDLRQGDADDPIPALLAVGDRHGNRVDLLAGLRGLDPDVFGRATDVSFHGGTLRVISREDFIAMKCFAGGPQDIADARQVLAAANRPIDVGLLRRVTRRFGRAAADHLEQMLGPAR
jgi:predicted nucleotidyltransferase